MKKLNIFFYKYISFISIKISITTDFGSNKAEAMLKKAINVINYDKKYNS